MNSDNVKEIRGILLVSLFIMVVPLILYPRDFGLKAHLSWFLLWAIELAWYALVIFLSFSGASGLKVIACAGLTLGYRTALGMGFGFLLLAMFAVPLSLSVPSGIHGYLPAILLQALMSPFALKSIFGGFMKRTSRTEQDQIQSRKQASQAVFSSLSLSRRKSNREGTGSFSLDKEVKLGKEDDLENILHYLREYAGVKAAILVDHEGLVVGQDSVTDFDFEKVASSAVCLKEANDRILRQMDAKGSERIGLHTPTLWLSLHQIESFLLVVVADRHTDELLSVRILQSTATIKRLLCARYPENTLKAVEG
ncbi:MAG: roadblock/LC7 domain-containing protein [Candidatus Zixiibacteriota bacterium]